MPGEAVPGRVECDVRVFELVTDALDATCSLPLHYWPQTELGRKRPTYQPSNRISQEDELKLTAAMNAGYMCIVCLRPSDNDQGMLAGGTFCPDCYQAFVKRLWEMGVDLPERKLAGLTLSPYA